MESQYRIFDENWVKDEKNGLYIAREPINQKNPRIYNAIRNPGLTNVKLNYQEGFVGLEELKDTKKLLDVIPPYFPDFKFRVLTYEEFEGLVRWAEENDTKVTSSLDKYVSREIVQKMDDPEKFGCVFYSDVDDLDYEDEDSKDHVGGCSTSLLLLREVYEIH